MKQTSRKKVLVSSAAMLMVATVSLGSATFAWFTQQPTASASNISISTNKSSGIVVKTEDASDYSTDSKWNDNRLNVKLNPASVLMTGTATDNKWYSAPKAKADGSAISTQEVSNTLAGVPTSYALKTSFSVKTLDETTSKTVSCTVNASGGNTVLSYIRVAVVKDGTVLGVYSNDGVTTNAVTGVTANSETLAVPTEEYTTQTTAFTLGTVSTPQTYDVYVWLEGQDTDCTDPKATTITATSIDFTLTDTSLNN